jgi:hypothetical protein
MRAPVCHARIDRSLGRLQVFLKRISLSLRRTLSVLLLLSGPSLVSGAAVADAAPTPQPITVTTTDGQLICNTSAAFSQIPGHPELFVGRGFGIGSLDYCHQKRKDDLPFLALFRMDWHRHVLTMDHFLLKPPMKTGSGVDLRAAYDPYVATYKGELWVAFECAVPGAVSSCVAPLSADLKEIDASRLSVPAEGILGPHGSNKQIVCILSASAPTLLNFGGNLYLYWQLDPFDNQLPENKLFTRGMQLQKNAKGLLWGVASGDHPVKTDDPHLTTLVHDVIAGDQTSDHVAVTTDTVVVGGKILEISSLGGTGGQEPCRSTHQASPGCWRVSLSVADKPLGANVFGEHPLPGPTLPANVIEYPRVIVGPGGGHYLLGYFSIPKMPLESRHVMVPANGVTVIPFEPTTYVQPH